MSKWITVKPNGPENKGRPVKIDESGRVVAGMGGKFNGEKISEVRKGFTGPKSHQAGGGSESFKEKSESKAESMVSEMRQEDIRSEIESLSELAKERMKKSFEQNKESALGSPIDYLNSAERERMHELKLALPSQSQERLEARRRIEQRAAERKASRENMSRQSVNRQEQEAERQAEQPKGEPESRGERSKPATTKVGGLGSEAQAEKASPASRKSRIREVGNNFLKRAKENGIDVDGVGKPQINALSNAVESSFAQNHVDSSMKFSAERGGRHDFDARHFFKGRDLETLESAGLVKEVSGWKYRFTEKGAHIAGQMFAYGGKGSTGGQARDEIALDSQRSIDESGHLRIARTVLSKAAVNPYFGREIPNYEELGLDPDKVYRLLRCPEALKEGADTFKGKQFLIKHEYVDSEDVKKDLIIGSIGSNVYYEDGTLYGDPTVWDASAIELIETKKMDEISASYWYKAVMEPGVYNGEEYDGIMTNIHGNHVALVTRGRIGRDAIISDSLPLELEFNMKLKKGAKQRITEKLRAIAQDGIASDSAEELIREVAENIEHKPAFDTEKLRELAGDNYDEIVKLIGGEAETSDDEAPEAPEGGADKPAEDEDEGPKADAERKELEETGRDDRDAKREAAMDADSIANAVQAKIEAKYRARDKVEQLVGRIAIDGFKDASEIYAFALKQKGVACDGVNEAGLAQLVTMAASNRKSTTVAQDADAFEPSALTSRFRKA